MKRMITTLILCIVAAGASAQTAPPSGVGVAKAARAEPMLQARFAQANTTHDGKLTRAQASAGMPRVAARFDEIDTARKGYVTLAEIEAFMQQQMVMSR